jgi:hypothetical protein
MASMTDRRKQAVTGLTPPQLDEAKIRDAWPSVAAYPRLAALGRFLMRRTIILAPLAWLILALPYFLKVVPGLARRYTLTNRRLMLQRGMRPQPAEQVPLDQIEAIHVREDANSAFFRAATLEIVSGGQVIMRLPGVPNPEAFRHAILNACQAWAPGKIVTDKFIPASAAKSG